MVDGLHQSRLTKTLRAMVSKRMIFDYEERRNALLADGYRLRHETVLSDGVMCRLHHMSNGNDVVIIAKGHHLEQRTNKVVRHSQDYTDD